MGVTKHIKRVIKQAGQQCDIWSHRLRSGGRFHFNGRPVRLPPRTKLGIRHAIAADHYEAAERELIAQYLRADLPVVELGGCLGLVSGFISNQLTSEVDHLIVEANPALLEACKANAHTERRQRKTRVVQHAIAYEAKVVQFQVNANAHTSRLGDDVKPGNITVPARTLSDLIGEIDAPEGYSLVSDIEGAEYDIFDKDRESLKGCVLALVEVHPDVFEDQGRSLDQFLANVRACGFKTIDHVENVYAFARQDA